MEEQARKIVVTLNHRNESIIPLRWLIQDSTFTRIRLRFQWRYAIRCAIFLWFRISVRLPIDLHRLPGWLRRWASIRRRATLGLRSRQQAWQIFLCVFSNCEPRNESSMQKIPTWIRWTLSVCLSIIWSSRLPPGVWTGSVCAQSRKKGLPHHPGRAVQ